MKTETTVKPASAVKPKQAPDRKLTTKQKAFIKHIVNNPKASATQAAAAAYGKQGQELDYATARSIASENLTKPNILMELSKYSETAENTLIEVMNYSKSLGKQGNTAGASYASTAVATANSILDRLHGKATTRIEAQSTSVTLNIDLSGNT